MKKTGLILWGSILCILSFMTSCERSEGEGGQATIEGYVYKIVDDGTIAVKYSLYTDENGIERKKAHYSFDRDTVVAAGEDVYIIYGGVDGKQKEWDRVRTLYNGKYVFQYLVEGNYSVYAYHNLPNKIDEPEMHSLKIGKKGVNEVPTIYIRNGKNAGLSAVVGRVMVYYDGKFNPKSRMDVRVYIRKEGTMAPFDDVRTNDEGYFVFTKLTPGKYIVYAATEGLTGKKDQIDPYIEEVEIPETINADGTGHIVELAETITIHLTYEK